jgi:hypothetical protein
MSCPVATDPKTPVAGGGHNIMNVMLISADEASSDPVPGSDKLRKKQKSENGNDYRVMFFYYLNQLII